MNKPVLLIAVAAALLLGASVRAGAQTETPSAQADSARGPGPYLPPDKRKPSSEPAASGPALHQQAIQKLKQRFEQADLDASGNLTKEEARKAGLGFVVNHFEQIDTAHKGAISFDDLKAYLVQRRKEARAQQVPGKQTLP